MSASVGGSGAGTNQEFVRRHNLGTLLGHVHRVGRISRSELTELMGLNRSTIGGLVAALEDLGLAQQVKSEGTRMGAGRPSPDVIVGDLPFVLAIDVRVDGLAVARVGLGGVVQARATAPILPRHDPGSTADRIAGLVLEVLRDVAPGATLVGVAAGVPGIIRAEDGLVRLAPNLGWRDLPFGELLQQSLGLPERPAIGNDADLGAVAEHVRGAGVGVQDLVYLSGEVGVGAGIVIDGRPLSGSGGYAGEIGHLPFVPNGRKCHCGARGCWETVIGAPAIAEAVECPTDRIPSLGTFLDGIDTATPALRVVARDLGRGLAGLVNVFNPRVVVLGGYLRAMYPLVEADVLGSFAEQTLGAPRQMAQIMLPGLGGDSVLLGAAELAFADLLADPVARLALAQDSQPVAG